MRSARFLFSLLLSAACMSCTKETWTPYDYGEIVPIETTPAPRTVQARLMDATSSTLTIQWSVSSFKNGAQDCRTPWKIGLYRDSAATQAVAEWTCSPGLFRMGESALKFQVPCFFFTGLEPGKTWYFKAEAEDCSGVFPFETTPFTRQEQTSNPARPGDLLLGEDFSEFVWGPHQGIFSVGYAPLHPDLMPQILPVDPSSVTQSNYYLRTNEFYLPWEAIQKTTRLSEWDMMPPRVNWVRDLTLVYPTPLGIQVYGGLSSAVVLPPLPALTKPSTVRVRIKTSKLPDDATLLVFTTTAASYELNSEGLSPGMIPIASFQRTGTEGRWSLYEAVLHNLVLPYRIGISATDVEFVLKEVSLDVLDQDMYDLATVIPEVTVDAPASYNYVNGDLDVMVTPSPWVLRYQVDYAPLGSDAWQTKTFDVWYNYGNPWVGVTLRRLSIGQTYRIRVQGIGFLDDRTQVFEGTGIPRCY